MERNLFNQEDMLHRRENNPESQMILDRNRKRLSEQCTIVLNWLMAGNELSGYIGMAGLPHEGRIVVIGDTNRRIKELKDGELRVRFDTITEPGGWKRWSLDEDEILRLKNILK